MEKVIITLLIILDVKIGALLLFRVYDFFETRKFKKEMEFLDNEFKNIKNIEVYK